MLPVCRAIPGDLDRPGQSRFGCRSAGGQATPRGLGGARRLRVVDDPMASDGSALALARHPPGPTPRPAGAVRLAQGRFRPHPRHDPRGVALGGPPGRSMTVSGSARSLESGPASEDAESLEQPARRGGLADPAPPRLSGGHGRRAARGRDLALAVRGSQPERSRPRRWRAPARVRQCLGALARLAGRMARRRTGQCSRARAVSAGAVRGSLGCRASAAHRRLDVLGRRLDRLAPGGGHPALRVDGIPRGSGRDPGALAEGVGGAGLGVTGDPDHSGRRRTARRRRRAHSAATGRGRIRLRRTALRTAARPPSVRQSRSR